MEGYELVGYEGEEELLGLLEGSLFRGGDGGNVVIVKDAEKGLVDYLVSEVFGIRRIIVYGGERDVGQVTEELGKIVGY